MSDKELVVVDKDLIIRLRSEGMKAEASELLKAHQKSIKKNFREGKILNKRIANKIYIRKLRRAKKLRGKTK